MSLEKKYFFCDLFIYKTEKSNPYLLHVWKIFFVQVNGSDFKNDEDPNYACCLLKFANT